MKEIQCDDPLNKKEKTKKKNPRKGDIVWDELWSYFLKAHSRSAICNCHLLLLRVGYIGGDNVITVALCALLH